MSEKKIGWVNSLKIEKREEVKRRERERESTTTRNLKRLSKFTCRRFSKKMKFPYKKTSVLVTKITRTPNSLYVCNSLSFALTRKKQQHQQQRRREKKRDSGPFGCALSLWCRRRKAFPLSFLPFFPANFLSVSPLYRGV